MSHIRKSDHLNLAQQSRINIQMNDDRFFYEPMLENTNENSCLGADFSFAKKTMKFPLWISSMTGGATEAGHINRNLAKVCSEFGLGFGLGSCRSLLTNDEFLEDFQLREIVGDAAPFYANLGFCQLEELVLKEDYSSIVRLVEKLQVDGLIVHINPFQEYFQPEGDLNRHSPLWTLKKLLENVSLPIIVKEVGQGMGPESVKKLLSLPIQALEFAAFGGTNFSKLEMLRSTNDLFSEVNGGFVHVGHSALDMVKSVNEAVSSLGNELRCKEVIISGGVNGPLDGYYLISNCQLSSVYGIASRILNHAQGNYEKLKLFVSTEVRAYEMANKYLRAKKLSL